MIRAALVDDRKEDLSTLEKLLSEYMRRKNLNISFSCFLDGEDLVTGYTADYDVLFLDVEMQFLDGMKTAKKIRELDREIMIVFVTCNPHYALEGYKVNAMDYLVKPISLAALTACMDRVLEKLNKKPGLTIRIGERGGMRRLDASRITYVEVIDHDLYYHTLDGVFNTKGTISEAEEILSSLAFSRCNRSFLVALEHVEWVRGNDLCVGKDVLQISRTRKKAFLDALNQYMED